MNFYKHIFAVLSSAAVLSCCQRAESYVTVSSSDEGFTATMEAFEAETKTSLNGKYAVWTKEDEIAIFQGTSKPDRYRLYNLEKSTFRLAERADGTGSSLGANIAVYPYMDGLECEKNLNGFSLTNIVYPSRQNYIKGSFAEESFLMVAVTDNQEERRLAFRNICGGLRLFLKSFENDDVSVKSITLKGNSGEIISGSATVICDKENIASVVFSDETSDSVTLENIGVQLSSSENAEFILSVPPTVFINGFTVDVNADINGTNSLYSRTTVKRQEIRRSHILTMPVITFGEKIIQPSLSISESELSFQYDGGEETVELTSNNEWEASAGADWLTIHPSHGDGSDVSQTIVIAAEANGLYEERTAIVTITSKDIQKLIHVRQTAMPVPPSLEITRESADVKAVGGVEFLNIQANHDWNATTDDGWLSVSPSNGSASSVPTSVKVTIAENPTEEQRIGEVLFAAGGLSRTFTVVQKGKIPEALRNNYFDENGVDHGPGIQIGDVIWAPVNCGYHESDFRYGKLYQWGRKYGQGYEGSLYNREGTYIGNYSDKNQAEIIEGPVDFITAQSSENADRFYSNKNYPYSWSEVVDGKLWNLGTEDNPVKTEYDPCPDGWRVPTRKELKNLSVNDYIWDQNKGTSGCWITSGTQDEGIFLQSAGYIHYKGNVGYRGEYGSYWSSSNSYPLSSALKLRYLTSADIPDAQLANGCSVRCVKDNGELVPVSALTLDKSSLTMQKGKTVRLSASIYPQNSTHSTVYWHSDNPSVASVDDEGNITAMSSGSALITALAGMQTAVCEIIVSPLTRTGN